jgi:hypothetical protein
VVKLTDDHGVEHSVKVRAASVYEAALKGLNRLNKVGWESNGSQIGSVLVEVEPGRYPRDNGRRKKLRVPGLPRSS